MRQQWLFAPTLRDVPADADIASHQLMLRAGLMRQTAAGIYSYLPLGARVLEKIETIVREEMNAKEGQELLMPAIQPAELWEESGRLEDYGPELVRLNDRHGRDFVLGPTHEEVITSLVRDGVSSYKKLPMNLYQIQTKYRDERRPRFGVLRSREFIMKDAYSFDATKDGLDENYNKMYEAYSHIFSRCGLDFRAVVADSGAIGGTDTHEFMVLSDIGEDTIAYSDSSSYAANLEIAELPDLYEAGSTEGPAAEKIQTPNMKTISEVSEGLSVTPDQIIKSVLFIVEGKPVLALCRGDHDINDVKIGNLFKTVQVETATEEEVRTYLAASAGYIGPLGVSEEIEVVADYAVRAMTDAVCGANEDETHYKQVQPNRDLPSATFADIRFVQEGDPSPDGKGVIQFAKGIEVGHVFKLGTKYSEALGAQFLDENGKAQPIIMGCYGIGISRTLAAVIEQHHDEDGIIWPKSVAPFDLHLLTLNPKNEEQFELGEQLYKELTSQGYDVLFDDRKERAGVKFKDADLYGLPLRIACGKRANENIVEVKVRRTGEVEEVDVSELPQYLEKLYQTCM
ncbi:proline--tRNA ligase [Salsuginibacillus kocurii]|uniref:proline--tRNA ligase n=1 Tax=Salsuginibacillus kocurii TaxID=427078 RepID=UPI000360A7D9|nr:proline--tRNA ligase [Salsuginibacillus kocurii]